MRSFGPLLLLLLAAIAPLAAQPQSTSTSTSASSDDDSIYWLDNYQEALKQAKATGKPIFLEYRCEP